LTSGRFTLTGDSVITGSGNFAMAGADLFGSGNLTLGNNFNWLNGGMYGDGVTRITGQAQLPQATGNRFIQRRLEVAGTLDANNNQWLYVQNGGMLHITSTGTLRSVTHDGNIYLQAGGSGSAAFSADAGRPDRCRCHAHAESVLGRQPGNTFSADVDLTGAGSLAFSGGLITLTGDSSIGGAGLFAMTGANVAEPAISTSTAASSGRPAPWAAAASRASAGSRRCRNRTPTSSCSAGSKSAARSTRTTTTGSTSRLAAPCT
jgi:hypothetical protein